MYVLVVFAAACARLDRNPCAALRFVVESRTVILWAVDDDGARQTLRGIAGVATFGAGRINDLFYDLVPRS